MRHTDPFLNIITTVLAVLFILIAFFLPAAAESMAVWVLLASVFIIGIPHGAIDHIMAAELYSLNQTLKDHLLFYASYLLIMVVVGALWIFYPVGGMSLFLIISIYHFGQADMEDFMPQKSSGNRLFYINRGLMIIGLIIFSDPQVTYPIIADAMRVELTEFSLIMPEARISIALLLGFYLTTSLFGMVSGKIERFGTYLLDSILLIAFLMITGPLIGFAIYFALWHSAGHINEMREFFEQKGKSLSFAGFYKKATPFTLVSILGLGFLFLVNVQLEMENQLITLMFILISVLTLPHMLIVERMYEEKKSLRETSDS